MEHSSVLTATVLNWTAPDNDDIAWYKVYRLTANNTALLGDSACIAHVPHVDTPLYADIHHNLGESWTRWYFIKAISWGNDSGAYSVAMSATRTSGATINGGLIVSGAFTVDEINVTGNVSVGGTLHVCGTTTFGSTVNISGNVSVSGTLHVSGATTFGSTVNVSGAVSISNTFYVSGAATFGSSVAISGSVSLGGTLNVSGDLTLNSTWRFTEVAGALHVQKYDGTAWDTVVNFNV